MGSSLGSALTRMCLIYCDVCFYSSLHAPLLPPLGARGRVYTTTVLHAQVTILECRYMDDYIAWWKTHLDLAPEQASLISLELKVRMRQRYPLPLKDDDGDRFVGLAVGGDVAGNVTSRPCVLSESSYPDQFDFPAFMHFRSYVPQSTKRAVVLGVISKVDRFTSPETDKPDALTDILGVLVSECGFPASSVHAWASDASRENFAWISQGCLSRLSAA